MKTYRVYLAYTKDFIVEANSYEEAIRKAHEGDVISTGSLVACPEDDYADEEKEADMVKITCYNKTEMMERQEAIRFYRECADNSEGSERERYVTILFGLMDGLNEVGDDLD